MNNKFIFDHIHNRDFKHVCLSINNDISFTNTKTFTLDDNCVKSLKTNNRPQWTVYGERYSESKQLFDIESYNNDYIILNNVIVNPFGAIRTSKNELYVNAGCQCREPCHYNFNYDIQNVDTVISISAVWANGIWHFPYEALVALMSVPKDILHKTKIHVSNISNYIIQWVKYLDIPSTQLITGNIFAKTVYFPRMGRCGEPYYSQINWLKNIINKKIVDMPYEYIILIKRNYRRPIKNYNQIEQLLVNFCKHINLKLYIHDDNKLPPLIEQQKIFNKAKVVFAPHGAGGIHIPAMKNDSWYIEFLSIEDINLCFTRLAYMCNINYKGISMSNLTINFMDVVNILNELKPIL